MKSSYVSGVLAIAACWWCLSPGRMQAASDLTPAQQHMAEAQRLIQADSKKPQSYNDLGIACVQRARETANPTYLQEAQKAVTTGLTLAPNDFPLHKTQVAILLAGHEYAKAQAKAATLNRQVPDDVTTYGYLAEADLALGNYDAAEKSAQWMLNLLPNNVPGLLIGAKLRDVYGDSEGALEMLNRAYLETSPADSGELVWIANQMASLEMDRGEFDVAGKILRRAEKVFPLYPETLHNLSRVKLSEKKWLEAIALSNQAAQIAPSAQLSYQLAQAQELAGDQRAAATAYANFQQVAKAECNAPDNANRELILYDASQGAKPAEALALAEHEITLRHDVWTLEAYADALFANGKYSEAEIQMQKALTPGVRRADFFDLAGQIAQKLGKPQEAAKYFAASSQMHQSQALSLTAVAAAEPESVIAAPSLKRAAVLVATPGSAKGFLPVPTALLTPRPTGTERTIQNLQGRIRQHPKQAAEYSALGAAFFQHARETGDVQDYQSAEESLNKSLELVPADFSSAVPLATMAEVCMGEHRFADALTYAQKALALGSGDVSPFAIVGDAYADRGEYEKAAAAYSRLQAAGEPASEPRATYVRDSRLAFLRFVAGDTNGAIALMQSAVTAGNEARLPSENLAWLYFETGEFYFQAGNAQAAGDSYLAALKIHPGDYRALAGLGKLRATQGRYGEAIVLYQKAIAVVPMPVYVAELGDLLNKAGNAAEAAKQFQLVEFIGKLGRINQVLHNRDLALFYADHNKNLTESLELARKEFEVRHDVYTWDALAWALYKNGMYPDASDAMKHALQFGTKDALLLYHAGMISSKLGQNTLAQQYLDQAIAVNPNFHLTYAGEAREELALLHKQAALTTTGELKHAQ